MTKPLADLILDDLLETAVWRIEDQNGIEMAVPVGAVDIPAAPDDLLIARTRFRLAGGAAFVGFSAPGDWPGLETIPPVILHDGRHLRLVDESFAPLADWLELAASPAKVFPVTVEPEVRVDGKQISRRYASDGRDIDAKSPGRLRKWLGRIAGFADDLSGAVPDR